MINYLCRSCGYRFRLKSPKKGKSPKVCPACSRVGFLVETTDLLNKMLKDASGEEYLS